MEEKNLEELDLGELEIIEKGTQAINFDFPVVHVLERHLYFNHLASQMVPKYIQWAVTPDYVVGRETNEKDKNAFRARKGSDCNCMVATFPAKLRREKKLQPGLYKVYKCKGGFAFKRYEQIEESDGE